MARFFPVERSLVGATAVVALVSACGPDSPAAVSVPVGVSHRLGSFDVSVDHEIADDSLELSYPSGFVVVLPGDTVAILERAAHRVFLVSPAGKVFGSLGGPGQGPGEFKRVSALATLDGGVHSGDLWVFDESAGRATVFAKDGRSVRVGRPPTSPSARSIEPSASINGVPPTAQMLAVRGLSDVGAGLFMHRSTSRGFVLSEAAVLADDRGIISKRFAEIVPVPFLQVARGEGETLPEPILFGPRSKLAFSQDGQRIYSVTSRVSDGLTLVTVTAFDAQADTIYSRTLRTSALPLSRSQIDSAVASRSRRLRSERSGMPPMSASERDQVIKRLRDATPAHRSMLALARAGIDGTLFIGLDGDSGQVKDWIIVSAAGDSLGTMHIDFGRRFWLSTGSRDRLWGFVMDSLDVPTFVSARYVHASR